MTVEFIQKRIEGKEKELAKLEKKMERIRKAEASNWENNPYYYGERDIRITDRDIEACKASLADYQDKLIKETEKANSRNIKVIVDFLNDWQSKVKEYYLNCLPKFIEARTEYRRIDSEYCDWFNHERRNATPEEIGKKREANRKAEKNFYKTWNWLIYYVERDSINLEKLSKDLQKEADAKYDDIIERTNEITGTITDATNLRVGLKGDLNGYIIGERGKAKVETIGAGGYNIQCYHFRTLINAMK